MLLPHIICVWRELSLFTLFYKIDIYYDTATNFDKYQSWGFLEQIYFDAILFNFLSVVATCSLLFQILKKKIKNTLLSFIGALMYLFGFGTIFFEFMPLTDAFSIFLFALAFQSYLDKKWYIIFPLAILILQREYIIIAFGTLAIMDFLYEKSKYFAWIFMVCIVFFSIHVILRKTLFYTPHLDYQASSDYFLSHLFTINFPIIPYLKQTAISLNLFFLYIGAILYKKVKGLTWDRFNFLKVIVLFLQINLICHVAGHGNNCGRYFYILIPLIIFLLIKEVSGFILNKDLPI